MLLRFIHKNKTRKQKDPEGIGTLNLPPFFLPYFFFFLFREGSTNDLCHIFSNAEEMLCLM